MNEPGGYRNHPRVDDFDFHCLLSKIRPRIKKLNTVVNVEKKLFATLRFSVTGKT